MNQHNERQSAETRPPGWVMLGWFYERGGQRVGPFSNEELRRRVAAGEGPTGQTVYAGWQNGRDVQFLGTSLRLALGEPESRPPATASAVPSRERSAARSTLAERHARPTANGPGAADGPERRRHARRVRRCVISYFFAGDHDGEVSGPVRVVDVSPGGIAFLADRRFETGATLTLCFSGTGETTALLLAVRVVRAQAQRGGGWLLGCRFLAELPAPEFADVMSRSGEAVG